MMAPAAVVMVVHADADADRADVDADDIRVRGAGAQQREREDRNEKRFHEPKSFWDYSPPAARRPDGQAFAKRACGPDVPARCIGGARRTL